MKKTLALVLAALMTAGMTTVAFAAKAGDKNVMIGWSAEDGNLNDASNVYYVINSDDVAEVATGKTVEGGDEIAIPLVLWTDVDGDGNASGDNTGAKDKYEWYRDTDDLKKPNVYTDWRIGDADAEIRMVKYGAGDYRYSVVVTVPENDTNKAIDLEGKIMVGRTKNAAEDAQFGSFDLGVTYAPAAETVKTYGGETLVAGETGIYKFNDDGEIDIEFGDQALFTVDVTGQSKLNLAWNTDFNKEFAAMYDYANIDFLTFEYTPSFNKTGTLYLYAPEDAFIYEVTADGAKEIKGLAWDEDYEAWTFKTRTLGAYAISDVELTEKTVTEDKDDTSSTTDGGKTNPDTGR